MAAVRTNNTGSAHLADHGMSLSTNWQEHLLTYTAATAALYATDPMRKRAGSEALSQTSQNQRMSRSQQMQVCLITD